MKEILLSDAIAKWLSGQLEFKDILIINDLVEPTFQDVARW